MKIRGRIIRLGDNVDTDVIIPARYLVTHDAEVLAKHVFEDYYPEFRAKASGGAIIVAGENFGLGSSREHAVIALKHSGVKAIVAKSFARIFYRNSINLGLPVLVIREAEGLDRLRDGDEAELDVANGVLTIIKTGEKFSCDKMPEFIMKIIEAGGLINYFLKKNG
ncbi:MAG: 3-isopropylmalate dehydratase small subunit [Thermoproteota archaeon]|nr:3-isopropylmalate dehydratase small subunit [Candidatus Brockarchaeota archaeon]